MSVPGALTGAQMDALLELISSVEMASSALSEDQRSGFKEGLYDTDVSWQAVDLEYKIEKVRRKFGLNQPEEPE